MCGVWVGVKLFYISNGILIGDFLIKINKKTFILKCMCVVKKLQLKKIVNDNFYV